MFYVQLIKLCNENNIKVTKVLNSLNLGTGNIEKWRNGTSPTGNTLIKFAEYFNVSTDYLLGLTDNPSPLDIKKEPQEEALNNLIQAINLSPKNQERLKDFLNLLEINDMQIRNKDLSDEFSQEG